MKNSNQDDFFAGIDQVDVWAAGKKVKLPIFYRDARAFIATFPASIFALKKLLPDPRFVPAQMFPGIGSVALACFEYYDTDVGPYNEFAFTILLNNPNFLKIPGYNLTRQLLQLNFYPYIYHLPVTTKEALRWGIDFSGFPKFLSSIDFEDTPERVTCELKEKDELICRLSGRKIDAPFSRQMKQLIHLYQQRQPQYTEFKLNAKQLGLSLNPGNVELEIGHSHPIAQELRRTLLFNRSLMYFYLPSVQFILYGPENISLPLMNFLMQKGMRIDLDQLKKKTKKRKV
jgi:hypothetical protein